MPPDVVPPDVVPPDVVPPDVVPPDFPLDVPPDVEPPLVLPELVPEAVDGFPLLFADLLSVELLGFLTVPELFEAAGFGAGVLVALGLIESNRANASERSNSI